MCSKGQNLSLFDDVLTDLIPGFDQELEQDGDSESEESLFAELDDLNLFQQHKHSTNAHSAVLVEGKKAPAAPKQSQPTTGAILKKVITLKMDNKKNGNELREFLKTQGLVVKDIEQVQVGQVNVKPTGGWGDSGANLSSPTSSTAGEPDLYESPSSTSGLPHRSKYGCKSMSKHAILARENRQKKKNYVEGLEKSVQRLQNENKTLKSEMGAMQRTIKDLQTEVAYLKSVIANQSTLSSLLRNIDSAPGIELTTSLASKDTTTNEGAPKPKPQRPALKRAATRAYVEKENAPNPSKATVLPAKRGKPDHDYASNGSIIPPEMLDEGASSDAGVCLHVSNKKVCLEFCSSCSINAATSQRSGRGHNTRGK